MAALIALVTASSPAQAADEVKTPAKAVTLDSSRLGPGLFEVAKLAQSGVDETVLLAFVEKNPLQLSPTADELVYLQSVGLSSKALVALMNSVQKPTGTATVQTAPAVQNPPVQATVVSPPVVYAPTTPKVVYVNRPYVDYVPYSTFSFGWDLGHHVFGHHGGGHHSFGHHGGGHHGGGHHGGHH